MDIISPIYEVVSKRNTKSRLYSVRISDKYIVVFSNETDFIVYTEKECQYYFTLKNKIRFVTYKHNVKNGNHEHNIVDLYDVVKKIDIEDKYFDR